MDLAAEATVIREASRKKETKDQYIMRLLNLFRWLTTERPASLVPSFKAAFDAKQLEDENAPKKRTKMPITRQFLVDYLHNWQRRPFPLDEEEFYSCYEEYLTFIRRKDDGMTMVAGTLNGHRSAVTYLFTVFGRQFSLEFETRLATYFKGVARVTAKEKHEGTCKVKEGKDALLFAVYQEIARYLLCEGSRKYVFLRTFMILSWNLMCRASNTQSVKLNHMEWIEDALGIYFAHQKNDQEGARPKDPRHIYANPTMPWICPILGLGVYWLTHPIDGIAKSLFPGAGQYQRFADEFAHLLAEPPMAALLEKYGLTPEDLGSHSIRKGAASYATSGNTACPPVIASHLRLGWAFAGVEGRYYRFQDAGDQYVGRTIAGNPIHSAAFALTPPYFVAYHPLIDDAIAACFHGPPHMRKVFEFCLASLVYHSDFLKANLPPDAPLFSSPLFTHAAYLETLKPLVKCQIATGSEPFQSTGIPPHVHQLVHLERIGQSVEKLADVLETKFDTVADKAVTGVVRELEARAIEARAVTPDGLKELITPLVNEIAALRAEQRQPRPMPPSATPSEIRFILCTVYHAFSLALTSLSSAPPQNLYTWGGSVRRLPEDFQFPKCALAPAWMLWCLGDQSKGYPPLRIITPHDLGQDSNRQQADNRRRLSEFRHIMLLLEKVRAQLSLSC